MCHFVLVTGLVFAITVGTARAQCPAGCETNIAKLKTEMANLTNKVNQLNQALANSPKIETFTLTTTPPHNQTIYRFPDRTNLLLIQLSVQHQVAVLIPSDTLLSPSQRPSRLNIGSVNVSCGQAEVLQYELTAPIGSEAAETTLTISALSCSKSVDVTVTVLTRH